MQRYSRVAIFLHWSIAAAIAFQASLGWSLEKLGRSGFALFQLHKSIGITILALSLLRVALRFWKPRPAPLEGGWEGALAKAVHAGLYLFMIGAPLTGWALVSTAKVKVPTLIFGTIPLPHLPLPAGSHGFFANGHGLLALLGMALLLLHVLGAVRHHWLLRDGLIWRMTPVRSGLVMAALLMLVPLGFVLGKSVPHPAGPAGLTAPVAVAPAPVESRTEVPVEPQVADNATAAPAIAKAPEGPPPAWAVGPGGRIGFSVGSGSDRISGGFARWTARIVMDPERPETANIRVEIDLASASVGDPTQDGMLAGDEFFAVAAHPTAVFTATGAERLAGNRYRANGKLTLKGVSAAQSIRFALAGSGLKRKVAGSAVVARSRFGVGNGESSAGLSPDVSVDFAFDAIAKQP